MPNQFTVTVQGMESAYADYILGPYDDREGAQAAADSLIEQLRAAGVRAGRPQGDGNLDVEVWISTHGHTPDEIVEHFTMMYGEEEDDA